MIHKDRTKQNNLAEQRVVTKGTTSNVVIENVLLPKIKNSAENLLLSNPESSTKSVEEPENQSKSKSLPETVAGRYKLERILGVGGMAIVYRAYDKLAAHFKHPSPYVALKIFKEEFAGYIDASYLLYSEYALLQSLNHPNIIRAYQFDIDMESERAFMILEFLKGLTLDQWLIENPLGGHFKKIQPMLLEITDTLCHSHQYHIIHGDLKPSNIMLTQEGCVLFDFGLGQAIAGDLTSLPKISRKRFNAWTPCYVAPELLDDTSLTIKTDIFALSCIIYELLTGKKPYYIDKKIEYSIKPVRPRGVPKKLWRALSCGLEVNPEKRIITTEELKEALQNKSFFG